MRRFAVSAALLFVSSIASADTYERLTVQRTTSGAVRDCYIWEEAGDYNGNGDTLYIGQFNTTDKLALLHFDVSSIPAEATVIDARLIVHVSGTSGVPIEVHPITADWVESAPTWSNFIANISPNVKATFTPVDGRNEVNVTYSVAGWVSSGQNFGIALRQMTLTPVTTLYSSDSPEPLRRPSLEVVYARPRPLVESQVPPLFASCGVPFRYQLRAHSPQATGYSITGEGPALEEATGELTWTPEATQRGAHSFSVTVSRGSRTEDLPVEIDVSCSRAMDVGFGCSASGAAPVLLALALVLRRRRASPLPDALPRGEEGDRD